MEGIIEIIKKRSVPGVLVFGRDNELLYFNNEAAEILSGNGKVDEIKMLKGKYIPREIYAICNNIKKTAIYPDCMFKGSGPVFMNTSSNSRLPYSIRSFSIKSSLDNNQNHIMVLLEGITEKRLINLEKIGNKFKMTKRESEVLKLICQGASNKDISSELSISEHTVKAHIKNIMKKMNAGSRCEIIAVTLDL